MTQESMTQECTTLHARYRNTNSVSQHYVVKHIVHSGKFQSADTKSCDMYVLQKEGTHI
jgi:hypothetical protein